MATVSTGADGQGSGNEQHGLSLSLCPLQITPPRQGGEMGGRRKAPPGTVMLVEPLNHRTLTS